MNERQVVVCEPPCHPAVKVPHARPVRIGKASNLENCLSFLEKQALLSRRRRDVVSQPKPNHPMAV